jgi:hypothetical protein
MRLVKHSQSAKLSTLVHGQVRRGATVAGRCLSSAVKQKVRIFYLPSFVEDCGQIAGQFAVLLPSCVRPKNLFKSIKACSKLNEEKIVPTKITFYLMK